MKRINDVKQFDSMSWYYIAKGLAKQLDRNIEETQILKVEGVDKETLDFVVEMDMKIYDLLMVACVEHDKEVFKVDLYYDGEPLRLNQEICDVALRFEELIHELG